MEKVFHQPWSTRLMGWLTRERASLEPVAFLVALNQDLTRGRLSSNREGTRQMQIPGNTCRICERRIVFANEGKFCRRCGVFVHLTCLPQAECDICGEPFQNEECQKHDPLRDAIVPPALRPGKSGAPMLVIGLALVLLLILVLLGLILENVHSK